MKHHSIVTAACLALSTLAAACAPVDVDGEWTGTWQTKLNTANGTIAMSLAQDGDSVDGSFDLGGTQCVGSGSVEGTIDGRKIDLTLRNSVGGEIQIDGTIGASSDGISGDFEVTGGLCENAAGRFEVRRD